MQLTQFTDYSLRALIYIALKNKMCTIKDISEAYTISTNHMIKIVHNLARLELIKTLLGKHGGIMIAVAPQSINLGDLVLKLEANFDLVPCFNQEKANCCIAPICQLRAVLVQARQAFMNVLNQFTLADIISNRAGLQDLLNIRT